MDEDDKAIESEGVTVHAKDCLPYLDMELFWNDDGEPNFWVHLKKNQAIKYLNKGSPHKKACFKATPLGVLNRLAKLQLFKHEPNNGRDLPDPHKSPIRCQPHVDVSYDPRVPLFKRKN